MTRLLRHRFLFPLVLTAAVGGFGLLAFGPGASADSSSGGAVYPPAPNSQSVTPVVPGGVVGPTARVGRCTYSAFQVTQSFNSGNPHRSTLRGCVGGKLTYGNSAIVYQNPSPTLAPYGHLLFEQECQSCHGTQAEGSAEYPNLQGIGAATVTFMINTGRMPASDPRSVQAPRKPARLTPGQAEAIAAWINSLTPGHEGLPAVPVHVNTAAADVSTGMDLFALNCAACHTITGSGDALAYSTFAPTLHIANPQEIVEAVRTGPGNMPRFTGNLSDAQVRDIAAYVTEKIQHPTNAGGNGLGGIGPVAEGFVGLLFGVGIFCLICFWIGERAK
jgi:ubiquinol-cytochrome c reductase cytochrome c subunit